jgi:two-component system, LytTR family, sensor kinase
MIEAAHRQRRWAGWAGLAVACAGFAVLNTAGWYPVQHLPRGLGPTWAQGFLWEFVHWELWVPLTAAIFWWVRKFPPRNRSALRGMLYWIAPAAVFPIVHSVLGLGIYFLFEEPGIKLFLRYRSSVLLVGLITDVIVTGLILGVAHARDYHMRLREEELRASELQVQLAQAQLQALKMQLHPHFLFNTLNAISSLQLEQPETAQRMLVRLAEFLRMTLEEPAQRVTLRREMDFISRYLEIERVRFPQKLSVNYDVAPDALDALVPNLILQPVVENAVVHGIAAKTGPGRIDIHATRRNGFLRIEVRDTGPGLVKRQPPPASSGVNSAGATSGIGLANIRGRLEKLYRKSFQLTLSEPEEGGVAVTIDLPFESEKRA